jgi:hypothetical protein
MKRDYQRVEQSHRLSDFRVLIPYWQGQSRIKEPFFEWKNKLPLSWYQIYNKTKHNRHSEFKSATFSQLMTAICGLAAVLSAQFYTYTFSPGPGFLQLEGIVEQKFEYGIGSYFAIQFPDWPDKQRYDWNYTEWEDLMRVQADPFTDFPFDLIG